MLRPIEKKQPCWLPGQPGSPAEVLVELLLDVEVRKQMGEVDPLVCFEDEVQLQVSASALVATFPTNPFPLILNTRSPDQYISALIYGVFMIRGLGVFSVRGKACLDLQSTQNNGRYPTIQAGCMGYHLGYVGGPGSSYQPDAANNKVQKAC